MKTWELINLDFDIPWIYQFETLDNTFYYYSLCYKLYDMVKRQSDWNNKIIKFNGYSDVLLAKADLFYLPNHYALKLLHLLKIMFNSSLFLECAIPTSLGILLAPKYQIIFIYPLGGKERKKVINFLYSAYNQITIHPVKFSKIQYQDKIYQYISFINTNEY